jgi:proteic killer suppression protein
VIAYQLCMNIEFEDARLAKAINSKRELIKAYGDDQGRTIMRRIGVLWAAANLADVPHTKPERRHELTGDHKGQYAVDLKHPYRLVFKPNHNPIPLKPAGGYDLTKITSIIITGVEDYH